MTSKFQDDSIRDELMNIARGLKAQVNYQHSLGVEGFVVKSEEHAPDRDAGSRPFTLEDIRRKIGESDCCNLRHGCRQMVFGEGPEDAELMFVGEAPGAEEDRQGRPFVGRAGQLLTRMIKAMKYDRSEVYIANVIKCRPPNNRDPKPDEVAACEPFLVMQIQVIKPKVIIALGRWAAQTLLKTGASIGALRGEFHDYHGIPLMPTYHPAAILRNPNLRKPTWEDLQLVMKKLGKEP